MKNIIEVFFIIFLMCGFAQPVWAVNTIRVVVYGDSLTSGYQLTPEDSYASKLGKKIRDVGYTNVEVINMSIPGETSSGGLERLSSLLVKQPDIAVLELGANDVIRGINPDIIYKNLIHIVGRLKENNVYVVLIGMKAPPNMGQEYGLQVESIYNRIATYYKTAFYPFALDGIFGNPELNLADGYHPNAKGIELMVENTYRLVDAGLRWKWDTMAYEEEYQRNWQQQVSGHSQADPAATPPAGGMMQQSPAVSP